MNNFKIKILIVEDNLSFALELQMLLEELNYNVIGRVDNSGEALDFIYSKEPDLILMDVDIKGQLTGLEIGQKIKHLDILVLYITSLKEEQHYSAAQDSNMIGYLVKPVEKITLRSTIEIAIQKAYLNKSDVPQTKESKQEPDNFLSNDSFFIKKRGTYHKVNIKDIAYIKSDDNYCETHTVSGEMFVTRVSISKMEQLLPSDRFMRTHRQYIVQISLINAIDFQEGNLKVHNADVLVSRAKRKELETLIKKIQ